MLGSRDSTYHGDKPSHRAVAVGTAYCSRSVVARAQTFDVVVRSLVAYALPTVAPQSGLVGLVR